MNRQLTHIEPGRPARPGQLILERRRRIVLKSINTAIGLGRVLDLGCGNMAQTAMFIEDADFICGLDRLHLSRTEAPARSHKLRFVQGDGEQLPFPDESFDTVLAFEVLEHLPDDIAALNEVVRVLKSGGNFLFTVPNRWWLFETHGAVVPGLNWLPWNRIPFISWLPTKLHDQIARARIYSLSRARSLAESAGLSVKNLGYVTAPLDVLSDGLIRRTLRAGLFKSDTTAVPFLAVNLFIHAVKDLSGE